jgi:hypothetical protein
VPDGDALLIETHLHLGKNPPAPAVVLTPTRLVPELRDANPGLMDAK